MESFKIQKLDLEINKNIRHNLYNNKKSIIGIKKLILRNKNDFLKLKIDILLYYFII